MLLIPTVVWNQYDNIEGNRTNNTLESWHSMINRQLNHPHPNIFGLTYLLKTEQQSIEQRLRLLQAEDAASPQRVKYRRITERLIRLRQRLIDGNIDVYQYVGAVAGVRIKLGIKIMLNAITSIMPNAIMSDATKF